MTAKIEARDLGSAGRESDMLDFEPPNGAHGPVPDPCGGHRGGTTTARAWYPHMSELGLDR